MVTYVGLDPRKDVTWITVSPSEAKQLLVEGKIDAFLATPPDPQELRARGIGHVVVNSVTDRPWSQYFCCMVVCHQESLDADVRQCPLSTTLADLFTLLFAANPFSAARASLWRWSSDEFEDGLAHGGQCRSRRRPVDSFFPALLF